MYIQQTDQLQTAVVLLIKKLIHHFHRRRKAQFCSQEQASWLYF
jgi:hypothetical protein